MESPSLVISKAMKKVTQKVSSTNLINAKASLTAF
jgi:hypothetical protein